MSRGEKGESLIHRLRVITLIILFVAIVIGISPVSAREKNVILIIPDGCSTTMWAWVRAITVGTDKMLNIDTLPVQSRCRTYASNAMITDSAAGATAFACGMKAAVGVLGMDMHTVRGDSLTGKPIESILEKAEKEGYATGIVTTSMIQHATPAAFYSHRAERDWYDLISGDLLRKGIDVIMGGGRVYMIPAGTCDEEGALSKRTDSRNIIAELQKEGYTYINDRSGFANINPSLKMKYLCLFSPGQMAFEFDRKHDKNGEPPLWEMAATALDILSKNKNGFFLMVESARIDHAAHQHDTDRYLWEGIACDKTIGVAMEFAKKDKNTLVIVVPDHGCGGPSLVGLYIVTGKDSTLISYAEAGFPLYRLDSDGFPVFDGGRPIAIQWIPWTGHTGEDVGVWAMGPNAEKLNGLIQNTDICRVMEEQLDLGLKKKKGSADWLDY
jgi:alkaline phosphatase